MAYRALFRGLERFAFLYLARRAEIFIWHWVEADAASHFTRASAVSTARSVQ
jgi:hypothetical protein